MSRQWRCVQCGKLLGLVQRNRLHIRFARGHEYIVALPATSICRHCRTLNELADGAENTGEPTGAPNRNR